MDNRPIGILDSGLGGLTALAEFRKIMPNENIIFFGDSARAPYGDKSISEIKNCASNILNFFIKSGVKAVLAACGTISVNAQDVLSSFPLPVNNVLNPSIEYLIHLNGSSPIGIIATEAAIKSKGYENSLKKAGVQRDIISIACPSFVPLIESGIHYSDKQVREAVKKYLYPIKASGVSTLLLGCTHYGIIEPAIKEYLGDGVEIVSASKCGATAFANVINAYNICGGNGRTVFHTSGDANEFRKKGSVILGYDIGPVISIPSWEV